jgi:hypothetical protein
MRDSRKRKLEESDELAHRILYAIGFTPWEEKAHPQIANQIAAALAGRRD